MTDTPWVIAVAVLVLLAGLLLALGGGCLRRRFGLEQGRTVALDNVTLTSRRYGLTCRPDRLVRTGGTVVPEEWKKALKAWPSHRAQLGVAFIVIEDRLGMRPTHGFVVLGDGSRHRVENTEGLRSWVLGLAGDIRVARAAVGQPIPVDPSPGQCRACGQRGNCAQANV
jgi:CRISPR/Cas system-associated exonuclease Cas4 (RecB family)